MSARSHVTVRSGIACRLRCAVRESSNAVGTTRQLTDADRHVVLAGGSAVYVESRAITEPSDDNRARLGARRRASRQITEALGRAVRRRPRTVADAARAVVLAACPCSRSLCSSPRLWLSLGNRRSVLRAPCS